MEPDAEVALTGGGRTRVHRRGNTVVRDIGPWTPAVHALLRHLEDVGFPAAPRLVGDGFTDDGREVLTFIDGEFTHPGPWGVEGTHAVGRLLRELHDATRTFEPSRDAVWLDWDGRDLGSQQKVIGHCDLGPWNIVARHGTPVAFIDWEFAGPVDPVVELAQVCWLNAKLHDDIVAEREGLPGLADRALQLRAVVDGYGLPHERRAELLDRMLELIMCETAWEADEAGVGPETTEHPIGLWAMAWRARAGRWIIRNRAALEDALSEPSEPTAR